MNGPPPAMEPLLVSRRQVLKSGFGLAVAGTLVAVTGGCGSTTKSVATRTTELRSLNVQLVWLKNVQFGGSFLAQQHSYYRRFGVDPNLIAGGPVVSVEPVVVQGRALVGVSNPDTTAAAVAHGAPLRIVATTYQRSPFMVMSPVAKPLRTPQALIGKRIGVPSSSVAIFATFLKANKIDPSKVTVVPVQSDPTPLVEGTVDGYLGFVTDEPIVLQLRGFATYQLKFADFGYSLYGDCYITTAATLANASSRSLVLDFLKAERLGWRLAAANPVAAAQAALSVSGKTLGLNLHQQTLESQAQAGLVQPPGDGPGDILLMKSADVTANLHTLALSGTSLTAAQLFDTSLMPDLASV